MENETTTKKIKFKVEASALNEALGVVSIVPPQATTPQGGAGYLFVVNGETCRVYSRDRAHIARASFAISDVEGEGSFMFPAQHIDSFKFVRGSISFTATETDGAFKVKYNFSDGEGASGSSDRVTFDPRMMAPFEKDITTAIETIKPRTFNISILREALGAAKAFLAKEGDKNAEDHYKTIQIFGKVENEENNPLAKANGYMFASNSVEAFYFYSEAFIDKDLVIPGQHLGSFESFMGRSKGEISVYPTTTMTYATNSDGHVFGWARHSAQYNKFAYYSSKREKNVLELDCQTVLYQLQYIRAELDKNRDKIRFQYDAANQRVQFCIVDENTSTTSLPIPVRTAKESEGKDLTANVNVSHMMDLFQGAKGASVDLRIMVIEPDQNNPKERFMFRTIDEFLVGQDGKVVGGSGAAPSEGTYQCKVTRFAPGKD